MADEKYVVRVAFGLGGKGVIVCRTDDELVISIKRALDQSPTGECQVHTWEAKASREARIVISETVWLIENGPGALCLGSEDERLVWVAFTDERAFRFSRQRDGLRVLTLFKHHVHHHIAGTWLKDCNVNEHVSTGPGDLNG